MIELLLRLFSDVHPEINTDGVFLFGQTEDNERSVLARSIELLNNSYTTRILFVDTLPMSGHPGYEAWKNKLTEAGVKEDHITGVPLPETSIIHTLIEAEAFMHFARQNAYTHVYITAAPFHHLRAFMTAVTAALRIYPQIRLYSQPGIALSWSEEVAHSQGKIRGTRNELITGELDRIEKYGSKGDLASVEQVLAYLNNRDRN